MSDPGPSELTEHLVRGLRIAQSVIVLVILVALVLPNLLATLDRYPSPLAGFAWFTMLFAVAVANAVLVVRRRSWGAVRWAAAVIVLAVSWAATVALPAVDLVAPAHVTLGLIGWFGVLLFSDSGFSKVLGFVGVHVGLSALQIGLAGRADRDTYVELAIVAVITGGFQLAVGAAGSALRAVGQVATAVAVRHAATCTAEAVARQVHADRELRYTQLRRTALPLLRGIGDGSLPASDPEIQRRAALEAARMRRMFAEDGDVADPLATGLAALIDVVERRGVVVRYSVRGARTIPPPAVRQALLDEVGAALLGAGGAARVTLGGVDGEVVVSVVADGTVGSVGIRELVGGVKTTAVIDGSRTWVEARWTPNPA
ncbi:MAG: hypothetical protein ACRDSZ_08370 [Pseudonocardiaceae bacterium]